MGPVNWDTVLFHLINRDLHAGILDPVMVFITDKPFLLFLLLLIIVMYRDRKNALPLLVLAIASVLVADWAGMTLKELIQRPRPFDALEGINLLTGKGNSYSMPSNHAANAFAAATAVYITTRDRMRYIVLIIAVLTAYSRPYVGVHYPSDVLAGGMLGIATAGGLWYGFRRAAARYRTAPYTTALIVFLAVINMARIVYITNGPLDLSPDETVYWEYTRRPALSYYEKGPLIAWLISLGTFIFGNTDFGVRIMAVVLSVLSSVFLFRLGSLLYNEKTGVFSAVLIQLIPLFNAQAVLMTIDAPYLFLWILSMYLFLHALEARSTQARAGWWSSLGAAVGLGLLAKYTMFFFFASAFLFLVFHKEHRKVLLSPWPFVGLAISLAVFSPVLIWNASNEWVTLKHMAGHANLDGNSDPAPYTSLKFVGSQLGVIGPVLLVMMATALFRLRKQPQTGFLVWFSAPMLLFFLLKSLHGKVQANWPMTGYVTGIIAFCACYLNGYRQFRSGEKHLINTAVIISAVITVLSFCLPVLGLPRVMDPSFKLRGWTQLAGEVSKTHNALGGRAFVFSDRYEICAEMAFYMENNPVTYYINLGSRMNQYHFWPGPDKYKGQDGIFVAKHDALLPDPVADAFDSCDKKIFTVIERGSKLRDFTIFTCRSFRGTIEQEEPAMF